MTDLPKTPGKVITTVEIIEHEPGGGFMLLLHADGDDKTPVTEKCSLSFDTLHEAEMYAERRFGVRGTDIRREHIGQKT